MLNKEVIVIGAGLGGLFSAALLSKEGMKVTVIEKNRKPGGGMQSYNRKGAVFDTDMHVITSMFEGGSVYRLCRYLGILNDICIENVADGISDKIYVAEDNSVYNISAGREGFMQSLLHYFPDEEHDICAYVKALDAITDEMDLFLLRNSRQNVFVQNADFFMPVDQFISKYIHNLKLRRLLAYMNVLYAGDCCVTPAYLHAVIAVLLQKGVSRFKGGTYRFVEVLVRFIQAHGGTVITGEGVSDIIVEGDKVKYVKTDAGRVLSADVYISSIHPAVLLDLLSDRFAVSKSYYAQLQGTEDSCSAFILNIKLKKDSFPYMRYSSYYFESYESVWSANRKGVITKFMFLTPPVQDQGEYAHTLCITVPMDWNEVVAWENSTIGKRSKSYYEWKDKVAETVLSKMERLFPFFREVIALVDTASPLTIRDHTGVRHGAMCGYKKDVNNFITSHLPVRTRLSNLLLTGQNVNIHGFCGVILTSLQTCEEILGTNYIIEKLHVEG